MGPTFLPELSVSVDEKTGNSGSSTCACRAGEVHETREVVEGRVFADYNASGLLFGNKF